jgi:hypothetical protein
MPPSFTVAQCEAQLQAWYDASLKLSQGKSVSIGGRSISRVNAQEIDAMITLWEGRLAIAKRGSKSARIRLVDPE